MRLAARSALLTLVIGALASAPSVAQACDMAEKLRLTEEQKKLASRNAWAGVERAYEALQATKCDLQFDHHFLGAESARMLGKVYEQHLRLTLAKSMQTPEDAEEYPGIQDSLDAIDAVYARVEIRGDPRRRPVLSRPEMPFAPDQRKAIEWAQTVVAETGSFKGMLPFGAYVVGEQEFAVEASADWKVVEVGKVKGPRPVASGDPDQPQVGGTTTESFVRYANLVATVGPGFLSTPESAKEVTLADGGHAFAPASVSLSGFGLQLGGEVGLTYDEPALGIATVVGYQGGFGAATFHAVNGWVAGVVRPGDLRVAVGPQFGAVFGSGSGVASWFDRGQDPNTDPNEEILYKGFGYGGGVQGAVGYGLLDFDTLQGIVELGGAWQSDGARSYYTLGLRVGIVPTVPRFKG